MAEERARNPNLISPKTMEAMASTSGSGRELFSEIFTKVNNAKVKADKIAVLRKHDTPAMRMILKGAFDPKIEWDLPPGIPPFIRNEAPAGTEHAVLAYECRKLYRFIKSGNDKTPQYKKEQMFIQMLEALHESEADLLLAAKDKKLHQAYKGLSEPVVKEAFGWTDEYKLPEVPVYPQGSKSASGIAD